MLVPSRASVVAALALVSLVVALALVSAVGLAVVSAVGLAVVLVVAVLDEVLVCGCVSDVLVMV